MLLEILHSRFGFDQFRPKQEAICQAVAEGRDALVVMPTGAGKSLCYQIPGLARPGTTLVISPLVALIEDQVQRLLSLKIKAGRIHSGRSRDESRETFKSYIRGELEFLFIAPERLAVPGFAEMLKKFPPSLIAVDEAHCISHWGHDFRPDYRLVGERLQGLEKTPVIALTATATAQVQSDICTQLKLRDPVRFIHGFRRENLAIQLVESLPSERLDALIEELSREGSLPAIVYAPTRKKAEEIALGLKTRASGRWKCAPYHAGMPAPAREQAQLSFIEGKTDIIVATVAFGMGIDKANVRTVVHAALPGSIEGYYQEIGRAGRDGLPARAILFHSFSDRRTHEFFIERDHPEVSVLEGIYRKVPKTGSIPMRSLQERAEIEPEVFEKALEKLWMHGGLIIDPEENISLGKSLWKKPYQEQRAHRLGQLDSMQAYTESPQCRMLKLIRHFGDGADSDLKCGICDRCAPQANTRALDEIERKIAVLILASLEGKDGQAVGRLFEDATSTDARISRSGFERVLSALSSSRFVDVTQHQFEKDGREISFRKVELLEKGRKAKASHLEEILTQGPSLASASASRKVRTQKAVLRKKPQSEKAAHRPEDPSELPPQFEALRSWRLKEAKAQGIPAFRILSDRVLFALCEYRPQTEEALLQVPGIGPKVARKYGEHLLSQLRT